MHLDEPMMHYSDSTMILLAPTAGRFRMVLHQPNLCQFMKELTEWYAARD
jgi:hypothetical protein